MAGFDARTCGVSVCTGRQSRDIAQGIDTAFELRTSGAAPTDPYAPQGAGDRGTHRTPLLFWGGEEPREQC